MGYVASHVVAVFAKPATNAQGPSLHVIDHAWVDIKSSLLYYHTGVCYSLTTLVFLSLYLTI